MEMQNQLCSDCGASGSFSIYDEIEEEENIRMKEDPEFAKAVNKVKRVKQRKILGTWIAFFIYLLVGYTSAIIGYSYSGKHIKLWFLGGTGIAIIIHQISKYVKEDSMKKSNSNLK